MRRWGVDAFEPTTGSAKTFEPIELLKWWRGVEGTIRFSADVTILPFDQPLAPPDSYNKINFQTLLEYYDREGNFYFLLLEFL